MIQRTAIRAAAVAALGRRHHEPALAQGTIKIGEVNSYKAQPAFLEPVQEGHGARGRRDQRGGRRQRQEDRADHARRQRAARATRCAWPKSWSRARRSTCWPARFLSNIGLALADFAKQKKFFYLAGEPLTDKIIWQAAATTTPSACAPAPTCRPRCWCPRRPS